jgi:single-stranded-DNA-specific exonuclease
MNNRRPTGKVWKLPSPSPHASQLAKEAGISLLQAQILINRGIADTPSAVSFLVPRLSNLVDPMLLSDMDKAVSMIMAAIKNQEKIVIYGDYDADGITATAVLMNFFSSLQIPVSFYIPNRLTEGYSLNPVAIEKIAKGGVSLMITVDCGTTDRREIELAKGAGMNIVVTDHHQVPEDFEPLCPVINPHRSDSSFPFKNLAGVGLAFFLTVALRSALRDEGWFKNAPEPDLRHYLDLVALGTVADMVPLLDQNRILVKWGVDRMKVSQWPGIKAIREIAAVDALKITSSDLAFKLAPRLNAPGRLGSAEMAIDLLTTDDLSIAKNLARQLNILNGERQGVEQDILDQIEGLMESFEGLEEKRTLVLSGKGWHKGVLGIVASRLVDKYHRPTLVLDIEDGLAIGSGRSIEGFNLHKALSRLEGLLVRFGGHKHAAGLALDAANVNVLAEELEEIAHEVLSEDDLIPKIHIDAEIALPELTLETVDQLKSLSPFGSGNPEPILYCPALGVVESRVVGERHLKLRVKEGGTVMEAIGFGLSDRHSLKREKIRMVFTPEINKWRGSEKIQLRIVDLELADHGSKLRTD